MSVMRGHWHRLIVQIAVLLSMIAVNAINEDLFVGLVGLSLVVLPAATWTVFGILAWSSHKAPEIESLSERVDDALSAALASTVAAVIGGLILLRLGGFITTPIGPILSIGLAFVLVTTSIPSLSFLRTWREVWLPMIWRRDR